MSLPAIAELTTWTMLTFFALSFLIPNTIGATDGKPKTYRNQLTPLRFLFFILGLCNLVLNVALTEIIARNEVGIDYLAGALGTMYIITAVVFFFIVFWGLALFLFASADFMKELSEKIKRGKRL